jgi:hypothetical protein
MKIVTKEYKIYNFNELSKEAKEYAINNWYEHEDYPFLEDDILEGLKQIDKYFFDVELQYSLSYSQGDGLSFKGTLNLKKFLDEKYSKKLRKSYQHALWDYIYSVNSTGNGGNYCYAHKNDIEYTENYNDCKEHKYIDKLWDDVLEEIKEYYIELCDKLEKYGYSILEYRMNNEEFLELCEANEYNFYKDGKMANL